jgi:hypothetical protein
MDFIAIRFLEWETGVAGVGSTLQNYMVVPSDSVEEFVTGLKKAGAFGIESSSPFQMVKNWR